MGLGFRQAEDVCICPDHIIISFIVLGCILAALYYISSTSPSFCNFKEKKMPNQKRITSEQDCDKLANEIKQYIAKAKKAVTVVWGDEDIMR
jgi:hypothetical protein